MMTNGSQLTVTLAIKGQRALYRCNGIDFPVIILDARKVWGRIDALITPVGGNGEKWIQADQLTMVE